MPYSHTGKNADPEFVKARSAKGGRATHTIDFHIRKIVDAAPSLTAAQRDQLAVLLRPDGGDSR